MAFDTLKFVEKLEGGGFSHARAKAAAEAFAGATDEQLATKADLREFLAATKADFHEFAAATKSEMRDLDVQIDRVEEKIGTSDANLKVEILRWLVVKQIALAGFIFAAMEILEMSEPRPSRAEAIRDPHCDFAGSGSLWPAKQGASPMSDFHPAGNGLAFNPRVASLPPYNAGMNVAVARAKSGRDDIARLASNENPYGCSPEVMAALVTPAFEPWRYADASASALREELAATLGVSADEIVVGNGSEEMIAAISRALLVEGTGVVTTVPSFGLHEIEPLAVGAKVVKIAMTPELNFDVDALVAAIAAGPRVVFIASPWNPVGPALDAPALERLVAAVKPGTLFVYDEAYFEFADANTPDGLHFLRARGVAHVVLRTFSKAYGLAGLRVGYAICSDAQIARVVGLATTTFNVNAAAQLAAIAAWRDGAWMRDSVAKIRAERERVAAALEGLGYRVAPSQTNFVFFDAREDSAATAAHLLSEGIIVKAWREPGYLQFVRATIGTPEENDRLIAAMAERTAP